jgi:hypothetical protein
VRLLKRTGGTATAYTVGALAEAPIYVINKTMDKKIVLKKMGLQAPAFRFYIDKKSPSQSL